MNRPTLEMKVIWRIFSVALISKCPHKKLDHCLFQSATKIRQKKSMWPFDLEFQSWTKGILMSSQTVHLAHFSTFSLSWNRGFLCPLIAWQSTTNLSFHSGRNKAKKSHFNKKKWFQFEFTCPKFFVYEFLYTKYFFDKFHAIFC